jgi:enoyl-CoA hydratase/carnithine racemase
LKIPELDDYKDKYEFIKLSRTDDGILLWQLHFEDGEALWSHQVHMEVALSWRDIGGDRENKVIILTGTDEAWVRREQFTQMENLVGKDMDIASQRAEWWADAHNRGMRISMDLLAIEQPMIAAMNGPCSIHAEIPLLCDIVLAAEHTIIADAVHFEYGFVPGDGVQVIFPLLMGFNRARYFMLTGQELAAPELLDLGLVNEVLPADQVLPRAHELARQIMKAPPTTVRLFRPTLTHQLKAQMVNSVSHGLMMEGIAATAQWPPNEIKVPPVPSELRK